MVSIIYDLVENKCNGRDLRNLIYIPRGMRGVATSSTLRDELGRKTLRKFFSWRINEVFEVGSTFIYQMLLFFLSNYKVGRLFKLDGLKVSFHLRTSQTAADIQTDCV